MDSHAWSRVAALGLLCSAATAQAALCARDQVPAATLLLPWFEASTACDAPPQRNTVFSVSNATADSKLARVVLWTNIGAPVFGFDVFLNGYAQASVDLHAMLCEGTIPSTGIALAEVGRHANQEANFPDCNATTDPDNGAPVYAALGSTQRDRLRAVLAARPSPADGACYSLPSGLDDTAVGYVTVDSVNACNLPLHTAPEYFTGLENGPDLAGVASLTDFDSNSSITLPMLAIEAAPGTELEDSSSFYGFAAANTNLREPLPVAWQADFEIERTEDQVSILAWRAPEQPRGGFSCAALPFGFPLPLSNTSGFGSRGWFLVDDRGKAHQPGVRNPFGLVAQRVPADDTGRELADLGSGTMFANLAYQPNFSTPLFKPQGWMGVMHENPGRYAHLKEGVPVGAACDAPPFDNTPALPRTTLD